jgi:hypothetical protein
MAYLETSDKLCFDFLGLNRTNMSKFECIPQNKISINLLFAITTTLCLQLIDQSLAKTPQLKDDQILAQTRPIKDCVLVDKTTVCEGDPITFMFRGQVYNGWVVEIIKDYNFEDVLDVYLGDKHSGFPIKEIIWLKKVGRA